MAHAPEAADHVPRRPPYIPGTPAELDAVVAAAENHTVLFENDRVRVLRVVIGPGVVENKHTHRWPSVFLINSSPDMKYFNDKGELVTASGKREPGVPFWVEPEGVHWIENHDTYAFDAIRVEVKD